MLDDEKGGTALGFLQRAIAWYAEHGIKVRRVMTDNGSGYVSKIFTGACGQLRLRHLRTRPYTPRTNGKAERLIQTLLREWAYAQPYLTSKRRTAALRPDASPVFPTARVSRRSSRPPALARRAPMPPLVSPARQP